MTGCLLKQSDSQAIYMRPIMCVLTTVSDHQRRQRYPCWQGMPRSCVYMCWWLQTVSVFLGGSLSGTVFWMVLCRATSHRWHLPHQSNVRTLHPGDRYCISPTGCRGGGLCGNILSLSPVQLVMVVNNKYVRQRCTKRHNQRQIPLRSGIFRMYVWEHQGATLNYYGNRKR